MASEQQVKEYLAYWLQLGKRIVSPRKLPVLQVRSVVQGNRYSSAFEECWQQILASQASDYYLEGTDQSIQDLLNAEWDLHPCGRCLMPVPIRVYGVTPLSCPCSDVLLWPNDEIPHPRLPVDTHNQLALIRDRLRQARSSSS